MKHYHVWMIIGAVIFLCNLATLIVTFECHTAVRDLLWGVLACEVLQTGFARYYFNVRNKVCQGDEWVPKRNYGRIPFKGWIPFAFVASGTVPFALMGAAQAMLRFRAPAGETCTDNENDAAYYLNLAALILEIVVVSLAHAMKACRKKNETAGKTEPLVGNPERGPTSGVLTMASLRA